MIMVDGLKVHPTSIRCFKAGSCHLTTDGPLEELHAFARRLGLKTPYTCGCEQCRLIVRSAQAAEDHASDGRSAPRADDDGTQRTTPDVDDVSSRDRSSGSASAAARPSKFTAVSAHAAVSRVSSFSRSITRTVEVADIDANCSGETPVDTPSTSGSEGAATQAASVSCATTATCPGVYTGTVRTKAKCVSWFQNHAYAPHYDLTPARRAHALLLGAVHVDAVEQARRRRAMGIGVGLKTRAEVLDGR